jgi:hypothetical protein
MPSTQNTATDRMIPIPGTSVNAFVVPSRRAPGWWSYTLFDSEGISIASDALDLSSANNITNVSAEQVARIAYILEFEHGHA